MPQDSLLESNLLNLEWMANSKRIFYPFNMPFSGQMIQNKSTVSESMWTGQHVLSNLVSWYSS